jgi:hypothetical protein
MVDARRRAAWDLLAHEFSFHANMQRNPKKKAEPWTPDDFNPYVLRGRSRMVDFELTGKELIAVVGKALGARKP